MGRRRDGREAAAQFLYSRDLNPGETADAQVLDEFWNLRAANPGVRKFANSLIAGTLQHLSEIDGQLEASADNFRLERFSAIDRNILRVAVFELLHSPDVPAAVVINEAIEIAKRFGGEESGKFVNGVLDRIRKAMAQAP